MVGTKELGVFVELLAPPDGEALLRCVAVQQNLLAFHQIGERFRPFNAIGLVRCEVTRGGTKGPINGFRHQSRGVQYVHDRGKGKTKLRARWLSSRNANRRPSVLIAQIAPNFPPDVMATTRACAHSQQHPSAAKVSSVLPE